MNSRREWREERQKKDNTYMNRRNLNKAIECIANKGNLHSIIASVVRSHDMTVSNTRIDLLAGKGFLPLGLKKFSILEEFYNLMGLDSY